MFLSLSAMPRVAMIEDESYTLSKPIYGQSTRKRKEQAKEDQLATSKVAQKLADTFPWCR